MAASNEAVKQAEVVMLAALFGSVALFCWLTFGSLRAVLCILVPLAIVAILCNALMATLGIGLKVATLPVMALGVGVGVDYGIYLYERIAHEMADGKDLRHAFYQAMCQRGTAAVFTALTMSIGVCTWAFAPLKFQADMGVLLSFMFWSTCSAQSSCCLHWRPGSIWGDRWSKPGMQSRRCLPGITRSSRASPPRTRQTAETDPLPGLYEGKHTDTLSRFCAALRMWRKGSPRVIRTIKRAGLEPGSMRGNVRGYSDLESPDPGRSWA